MAPRSRTAAQRRRTAGETEARHDVINDTEHHDPDPCDHAALRVLVDVRVAVQFFERPWTPDVCGGLNQQKSCLNRHELHCSARALRAQPKNDHMDMPVGRVLARRDRAHTVSPVRAFKTLDTTCAVRRMRQHRTRERAGTRHRLLERWRSRNYGCARGGDRRGAAARLDRACQRRADRCVQPPILQPATRL